MRHHNRIIGFINKDMPVGVTDISMTDHGGFYIVSESMNLIVYFCFWMDSLIISFNFPLVDLINILMGNKDAVAIGDGEKAVTISPNVLM